MDILNVHAMVATNSSTIEDACLLLELAAAAGALSLVVCYNQYRPGREQSRSSYYAYPLVDTRILLQVLYLISMSLCDNVHDARLCVCMRTMSQQCS